MRALKKYIFISLLIFISIGLKAQDVKTIFNKSKSSIVLIMTYDSNQAPLALGSGFYFRKNLIATNYHVIKNSDRILIKNLGTQVKSEKVWVKSYSEELDVAILEVGEPNATSLLLNLGKPEIGDKILAIGNPKGLEGTISTGIVSGIRQVSENYNLIQITSPISPGSSGGPVLDENGNVIGISTFTIKDSQNLNFAVPSNAIPDLETKTMKWEPIVTNVKLEAKNQNNVSVSFYEKLGHSVEESVSLINNTNQTISNIKGLIIYKDDNGNQINYSYIELDEILMPGMAKLDNYESFDQNRLFYYKYGKTDIYEKSRKNPFIIEFRLLDYEIIESDFLDRIENK
ncbi:S1C family serine protease [Cognataquiflexum rubidum]|uniref:S1C family serine protease n=1 Tax=Cognataquiflexum rubidum TaxID=2922273 RepID=UPI001F142473|nr:S1C family serine protease [Cognataquiflexum rubidum]MCH6232575.1 S1C family serine protease [Cognataquiflexum rubidum]